MKSKKDIQTYLGVSSATIHNWLKTGVIPDYPNNKHYSNKQFQQIIEDISSKYNKLTKMANRSKSLGFFLASYDNPKTANVIKQILKIYKNQKDDLNSFIFMLCLVLLQKKGLIKLSECKSELNLPEAKTDFLMFLSEWQASLNKPNLSVIKQLIVVNYPDSEIDFLGICYESLRTVGEKATYGAFFTPAKLLTDISPSPNQSIFDPCAGTGSIVLKTISKNHNPAKIFLADIDKTALKIARINFALFFESTDKIINIENRSILDKRNKYKSFDFTISNPPFGAKLSSDERKKLIKTYPEFKTSETFSIALINSLKTLDPNGKLVFILPESFLYVKSHSKIRKHIFEKYKNIEIRHFGNAFNGVMSKIIRLSISKSGTKNVNILRNGNRYIYTPEILKKNEYCPPYISDNNELKIIDKVLSSDYFTLKGLAEFGLGIVTGNNNKHLNLTRKSGMKPIYTGKELKAFYFTKPKYFINFNPEQLQQVAPLKFYKSPKICYNFISNNIKTCVDYEGVLVLNSINCFIPDKSLSLKAVSAFFNSLIVSFLYSRLYNSSKVLRKHLESIPIPKKFIENQRKLESFYDMAASGKNITKDLHYFVCELYGLNKREAEEVQN